MKLQIGYRETSSAMIIFSLAPVFSVLVGKNSEAMGVGAVLNCAICFMISLGFLFVFKLYFKKFNSLSIIGVSQKFGLFLPWIITLIFSGLIFGLSVFSVSSFSQSVYSLVYERIEIKNIRLIFCITSGFCAWLGLEAFTRQAYALFYISVAILVMTAFSVLDGLNPDNLYPMFGTDLHHTFLNGYSFSCLSFTAPFLLICDHISDDKAYACMGRSLCISYAITFLVFLLYSLTVTRPLGTLFGTSLDAILASSSSGSFFHRFELFMASLYVVFAIVSSSFSLISVSCAFSKLCRIDDIRPFVLVLSALLYVLSSRRINDTLYLYLCIITAFVSIVITLAFLFTKSESRG